MAEEEKEGQLNVYSVACEIKPTIAQQEGRLATAVRLNLAQAELNLIKKIASLRRTIPPPPTIGKIQTLVY